MKMVVAEREIDRVGVSSNRSYGMKPTGKAFWILSSGLYKDKIRAIIREYSCNARDAHILNGNEATPFHVHLPNRLEPFFRVRDFGPGLSDDDVMTVFATYFESLKDTDDRFTGCLGLGSKSAFSYVDSFTVVSRHAGVKTTYAAYMDEEKCPNICVLGVPEICNEPSGLEVVVPVDNTGDFHTFEQTARSVLAHFDPEPVVEGVPDFVFERYPVQIAGDGYRILKGRSGKATAVMGSIAYPIDVDSLGEVEPNLRSLLSHESLEIDFALGTLDFTAGREELSYDPPVVKAVIERGRVVLDDLRRRAVEPFAACRTMWDALCVYDDLRENFPMWGLLDPSAFQWTGGRVMNNTITIPLAADFANLTVLHFPSTAQSPNSYSTWAAPNAKSFTMGVSRNTLLLFDDLKRGAVTRVRHYRRENGTDQSVILFRGAADDLATLEMLFERPLVPVSSLPEPPVVKRQIKLRELTVAARARSYLEGRKDWRPAEVDPLTIDPPFYIRTVSGCIMDGEDEFHGFGSVFDDACTLKLIDRATVPLYQVPKTLMPVIDDLNWVELFGYLRQNLQTIVDAENIAEQIEMMASYRSFNTADTNRKDRVSDLRKIASDLKLADGHSISLFLSAHDKCRSINGNRVITIERMMSYLGMEVKSVGVFGGKSLTDLYNDMIQRLPMLYYPMTERYFLQPSDVIRVRDYIKTMENA